MKTFRYIVTAAIASAILASCSGWLEEDPKANADLDKMAATEKGLDMLLMGTYGSLQKLYTFSNNPGVVGTDECMTLAFNQKLANPLDLYIFTPSNAIFTNAWEKSYSSIQSANIVIDRAYTANISEGARLRMLAEARFIRAFVYFRMVQWFGDVPLITNETPGYDKTVTGVARSPLADVYELIVSDLQFAATDGILSPTAIDGRVTQSAAQAMLAKVYLTMGTAKQRSMDSELVPGYNDLPLAPHDYYRMCYDITDALIKGGLFSLAANYGDLFLPDKKFANTEAIWEIQFSPETALGSSWSKYFGQIGSGAQIYTYNAMVGRHIYQPVPGLIGYYKRGDRRYAWNIKDYQVNVEGNVETGAITQGTKRMNPVASWTQTLLDAHFTSNENLTNQIGCSKYRWGKKNGDPEKFYLQNDMNKRYAWDNCPNNVIVLRYADVILMFAEADLLLNGGTASDEAVKQVNKLLFRARDGKTETQMFTNATNNQGDYTGLAVATGDKPTYMYDYSATNPLTYAELKKERARELCFEFHRWFDLVRWGDLESAVNTRLHFVSQDIKQAVVMPDRHYLFPIPQSEIDISHIAQNPNYTSSPGSDE